VKAGTSSPAERETNAARSARCWARELESIEEREPMNRIRTTLVACLMLCAASSVHAQDASCPASNRLTLTPHGSPPYDTLDGARYEIVLGRGAGRDGSLMQVALVIRNGVCMNLNAYVGRGGGEAQLGADSNLCLGSNNDRVTVVTSTSTHWCGGTSTTLQPFAYNGHRLSVYGGGGSDTLLGGSGMDSLYGGGGSDALAGGSGSNDRLYGESGPDIVAGSTGSLTRNVGGDGNDAIVDRAGISDTIDGGANDDRLESGCNNTPITCGSGTDTAFSPNPRPFGSLCETWNRQSC
jgi:Ca2+-binding RTX toxin-like protein